MHVAPHPEAVKPKLNQRGHLPPQGCYCAHALRFFPGLQPTAVLSAAPKGELSGCDTGMEARVVYGGDGSGGGGVQLVGRLEADLRHGGMLPVTLFTAEGTRCVGRGCGAECRAASRLRGARIHRPLQALSYSPMGTVPQAGHRCSATPLHVCT